MFHCILVPVDTSTRAAEAVDVGRHLAKRLSAHLVLLRVAEPVADMAEVTAANQELGRQIEMLRDQGLDARYILDYGHPENVIAQTASAHQVDLIVTAPHRRTQIEALRHPSVTARLFSRAPAPLLVWPEASPDRSISTLLNIAGSLVIVPLDGSALAEQALPFAVALAREFRRPLLLLRVVTPAFLNAAGERAYWPEVATQAKQEMQAQRYLRAVRQRLASAGLSDVQSMRVRGEAAEAILQVAATHNGSLLVMSTHGRGGFARLLAGSVATTVMHATPLPLLVVPPHATPMPADSAQESPRSTTRESDRPVGHAPAH
jgi:nucleotide-binding universal stress UspA family protein